MLSQSECTEQYEPVERMFQFDKFYCIDILLKYFKQQVLSIMTSPLMPQRKVEFSWEPREDLRQNKGGQANSATNTITTPQ